MLKSLLIFSVIFSSSLNAKSISHSNYDLIAQKIYQNECAANPQNLLFWNEKEPFPSLGIAHFIWFPKGVTPAFEQVFPEFLAFVQRKAPQIPIPVSNFSNAPWQNREVFYALKELGALQQWQAFFESTFSLQAEFIVYRFQSKLTTMIAQVPDHDKQEVLAKLNALMQFEKGQYLLIDYTNFKGIGINPKETYQGQGWGLLQVLQTMEMPSQLTTKAILDNFIRAAKQTLKQRTELSANPELEATWLEGWFKRLDSYR